MNELLDITGHFLYIAWRLILLPVFVALDCFLGLWMAAKFISKMIKKHQAKIKRKQPSHHLGLRKSLVLLRAKFIGVHANGH
jgi:hypothetical protein